ncbi:MAG: DEAD/DEAH box helicase [Pseudomonadales bacterium]|nr:DEAD/DEAH box helicase [Pseudomonadales bacterium]
MGFDSLGFSKPILRAVLERGYTEPTPIQSKVAPVVLAGKDLMASAQTGTGKTAGFTLPLLEKLSKGIPAKSNRVRVLIITPTRELAAQVQESVSGYGKYLRLKSAVVFGGVKINPQMKSLRGGVDVLVATPGRLLDLYQQNAVKFNDIETLVLDEADRMLDMGFINDIKKIQALLPKKIQTLLFSATFSDDIRKLAKSLLVNPVEIDVAPRNAAVQSIVQRVHPVDKSNKTALLCYLIKNENWFQVLVFCRTKHGANRLVKSLSKEDISAIAIHGNKSQNHRTKALKAFKNSEVDVLVATDIAARGLDIAQLPQVVNFDLPNVPEDYVHRIGRTGRAGHDGQAISLVCADEIKQLVDIERLLKKRFEREEIEGFEAKHVVPDSGSPIPRSKSVAKKPRAGKGSGRGSRNSQVERGRSGQVQSAGQDKDAKPKKVRKRKKKAQSGRQNTSRTNNSSGNV